MEVGHNLHDTGDLVGDRPKELVSTIPFLHSIGPTIYVYN